MPTAVPDPDKDPALAMRRIWILRSRWFDVQPKAVAIAVFARFKARAVQLCDREFMSAQKSLCLTRVAIWFLMRLPILRRCSMDAVWRSVQKMQLF